MDYLRDSHYDGAALLFFPTAEGYVSDTSGVYNYVYNYTDQVGNIRSYGIEPDSADLQSVPAKMQKSILHGR